MESQSLGLLAGVVLYLVLLPTFLRMLGVRRSLVILPLLRFFGQHTWLGRTVLALFFMINAYVGATKPDGGSGEGGLARLMRLAYAPTPAEDLPVDVPTEFSTNELEFSAFSPSSTSLWFAARFSESMTSSNDTIELFATHLLPFTNAVKIAKVPIWPQLCGLAFELDKNEVLNLYSNKTEQSGVATLLFRMYPESDTDKDGRSNNEEELSYGSDPTVCDYDPDPEIPTGEVVLDYMPMFAQLIDPVEFGDGRTIVHQESGSGVFIPATSGYYKLTCTADDLLNITVGPLSASACWSMSESRRIDGEDGPAWLVAGVEYPLSYHFEDYGGLYGFKYDIKAVGNPCETNCSPTFSVSPLVIVVSRKRQEPEPVPTVTVVDPTGDGCATYTSETVPNPTEERGWFKKIVYSFFKNGKPCGNAECFYIYSDDKDESKCEMCCTEGSATDNGCVSFRQRFGRTPRITGLPAGSLVVEESFPTERLFSNAALKYDHPMMREMLWHNGYDAVVRDGRGRFIEYKDGKPVNWSQGRESFLYHDGTNYIEHVTDGLEVVYSRNRVAFLKQNYGARIPVSDLGITVQQDDHGRIASVASESDGTVVATNLSSKAWRLTWTSPGGAFVKSFTFTCANSGDVSLHEYRNDEFQFDYRWVYDGAIKDWNYTKGTGASALRKTKEMQYDATNKVWLVNEKTIDANSNAVVSVTSILDVGIRTPMTISRSADGKSLYSASRDANGFVVEETDEKGLLTQYVRDTFGRVQLMTRNFAGTIPEETYYSYAPGTRHHPEKRPVEKIVKRRGITILHENYEYTANRKTTYRTYQDETRVSFEEFDDLGRQCLSVGEDGRARRTIFSSASGVSGWTERTEEGIWNGSAFEFVPGKSTALVRNMDSAGNAHEEIRQAYLADGWHEIDRKTMTYDAAHRVVSSVDSTGKTTAAEWICTGPVWTRSEDGIVTSNAYNSAKALVRSTRYGPFGAVETTYVYDAAGRVTNETQRAEGCPARVRSVAYDARGRVVDETGFDGIRVLTSYSQDDRVTTWTYPDGGTKVETTASDGTILSENGTSAVPIYYTYDVLDFGATTVRTDYGVPQSEKYEETCRNAFGETVWVERSGYDGDTLKSSFTYDAKGRLVRERTDWKPEKDYSYDDWGDLLLTTETADGVSRYSQIDDVIAIYDDCLYRHKRNSVWADGIAPFVEEEYEQLSGLSLTNESRVISFDKYNARSEVVGSFDPTLCLRRVTTETAKTVNRQVLDYVDGLLVRTVSVSAVTNAATYNAYGWQIAAVDGRGNQTAYSHDARGNRICETDSLGYTVVSVYDEMNRLVAVTNQVGAVTCYEYDLHGRKTYEGGATYPVRFAYDLYGNRISMTTYRNETSSVGDKTQWIYDIGSGLVKRKIYADGNGPHFSYSSDGKLLTRTWARGVETSYGYDGWGNRISTTYDDGTPPVALTYDALGRKISVADVAGLSVYTYDTTGDVIQVSMSGLYAKQLNYCHDVFGRDIGHVMDGTRKNIIAYDAANGRVASVTLGSALYSYSYLPGTDLKSRLTIGTAGYSAWSYEPHRDLLTRVENRFHGRVVSEYDYTYDAAGRCLSKNDETYGYNSRGELVSASENGSATYAYSYDDIGNRTASTEAGVSRTYAANPLNQYVGSDYDLDGNQTNVTTRTGVWAVVYNGENRPVLWTSGTTNIVMKYDHMGRRVEYVECDGSVTNRHQKFVYDGYLCIQRLNRANNDITELFEWDPTEPVATRPLFMQIRESGQDFKNYFYAHDGNKNVADVISYQAATGAVAHYDYAPFGDMRFGTGTCVERNPYRFSSEYADDVLFQVYYIYRHLEPLSGRWTVRDAIGEVGGVNIYAYCLNRGGDSFDVRGLKGVELKNVVTDFELPVELGNRTLGVTEAVFETGVACLCDDTFQGWILSDWRVVVQPVVHLRRLYSSGYVGVIVTRNEQDHVNDITRSVSHRLIPDLGYLTLIQSVVPYETKEQCETRNLSLLDRSVFNWYDTVKQESKERWDDSGLHDVMQF